MTYVLHQLIMLCSGSFRRKERPNIVRRVVDEDNDDHYQLIQNTVTSCDKNVPSNSVKKSSSDVLPPCERSSPACVYEYTRSVGSRNQRPTTVVIVCPLVS